MTDPKTAQHSPADVLGRYLSLEERAVEGHSSNVEDPKSAPQLVGPTERVPVIQHTTDLTDAGEYPLLDLLQEDADRVALIDQLRTELRVELARQPVDVVPGNRWLVNELYRRVCGPEPLYKDELLRFLRATAVVIGQEVLERACRHSTVPRAEVSTVAYQPKTHRQDAGRATNVTLADAEPKTVLDREVRRQELTANPDSEQQRLADLFALAEYAGRSAEELADLFDRPVEEVRTELALTRAYVRGEDLGPRSQA